MLLNYEFAMFNEKLDAIAKAISESASTGGGGTTVDLTALVDAIKAQTTVATTQANNIKLGADATKAQTDAIKLQTDAIKAHTAEVKKGLADLKTAISALTPAPAGK